ncbi:hypothetical protein, partial [Sphingomonas sp. 66-10]
TGIIDPAATALAELVQGADVSTAADRILSSINLYITGNYDDHFAIIDAVRLILDRRWDDILR